jgi:hypothetical protein
MPNSRARPLERCLAKAEACSILTPILERASVPNLGDQRCRRHRADALDLAEPLADLAVAIGLSDLSIVTRNPSIEFRQFFPQLPMSAPTKGLRVRSSFSPTICAKARRRLPISFVTTMPCSPRRPPILIDQPDAISHKSIANPMNRLHRQLLGGLDRHEAHVWSADRFADRFRVISIVLVGLHVGRDELRTDQSDVVTKFRNRLRPKVRPV